MSARFERLMAELARIGPLIPHCYFISAESVDGLPLGRWIEASAKDDEFFGNATREDYVSPFSAAILSLSERITTEVDAGSYQLAVLKGAGATFIQVVVSDAIVLFIGVRELDSVDNFVRVLWQRHGNLIEILSEY